MYTFLISLRIIFSFGGQSLEQRIIIIRGLFTAELNNLIISEITAKLILFSVLFPNLLFVCHIQKGLTTWRMTWRNKTVT